MNAVTLHVDFHFSDYATYQELAPNRALPKEGVLKRTLRLHARRTALEYRRFHRRIGRRKSLLQFGIASARCRSLLLRESSLCVQRRQHGTAHQRSTELDRES